MFTHIHDYITHDGRAYPPRVLTQARVGFVSANGRSSPLAIPSGEAGRPYPEGSPAFSPLSCSLYLRIIRN